MRRYLGVLAMTAVAMAALGSAACGADDENNPTFKVVLHPAPAPRPALKYQLLPPLVDCHPGNAATQYLKAPHEYSTMYGDDKLCDTLDKLRAMPLPELRKQPVKEVNCPLTRPVGSVPNDILEQLDMGARCESCDWALPIHECDYDSIVLAEVQDSRLATRILAVRARLQIADGRFDEALRTLQTGYALGRHVADGPFVIQSLIGASIAGAMSDQVETWIQQPGAPNLYWALESLPRPMIDCRLALEAETEKAYLGHPELRDLENKRYSPEQWQELLERTVDRWQMLTDMETTKWPSKEPNQERNKEEHKRMLQAFLDKYIEAKKALAARGRPAAEVDAMPHAQVVLVYMMQTYDERRDELFKWLARPYAEARAKLEQTQKQLGDGASSGNELFASLAGYAMRLVAVKRASGRVDRGIAGLQILEAIRMYAAAHDGKLPETLKDITDVPIPIDPLSGEPFSYRREGSMAMLESAPAEASRMIPMHTLRYEIRMEPAESRP
jgi:hypothetical protein